VRFAWLTPYTGNKHNRAYFTQLVLAEVAKAKFVDNLGRLPRLMAGQPLPARHEAQRRRRPGRQDEPGVAAAGRRHPHA
jgi:hypothetical protein